MAIDDQTDQKVIKASEFKANCLKLMDAISESGEEIVITKNGKPIAKLVPYQDPRSMIGMFEGEIEILGDIMEPIDVEWDAQKDCVDEDYDE